MGDAPAAPSRSGHGGSSTPNVIARSEQPLAHHDVNVSLRPFASKDHQSQPSTGAPFYSQFDSLSDNGPRDHSRNSGTGSDQALDAHMARLDMNDMGHGLPRHGGPSMHRHQYAPSPYGGSADGHPPPNMQHHTQGMPNYRGYVDMPSMTHAQAQAQNSFASGMRGHDSMAHAKHPQAQYMPYMMPYGAPHWIQGQGAGDPHGQAYNVPDGYSPGMPMFVPVDPRGFVGGHQPSMGQTPSFRPQRQHGPAPIVTSARDSMPIATPSYPRGPPRKPKQSGHALWVGNLPPGVSIHDLKDHFSRDATNDIESLFLISKSNCAFVNYRTEAACVAAMNRFHDSRFHSVRLVCRLRRGSVAGNGQQGQSPASANASGSPLVDGASPDKEDDGASAFAEEDSSVGAAVSQTTSVDRVPEKFFIVKSLTIQDLEASVREGVWATQSHNEKILSNAYETADSVYLIFSANKSGEYYGYAKMKSPIDNTNVTTNPRAVPESADPTDGPTSMITPATETAPRGHIIDDSARGTIFWEADLPEGTAASSASAEPIRQMDASQGQDWGRPFQVEWLSTNRLPFYRTRGLRNPCNANREVKIARDGTELEASVGRRLLQMFHKPAVPGGVGGPGGGGPGAAAFMGSMDWDPRGNMRMQDQFHSPG